MAEFNGFILTNKGRELLTKTIAGETLTFTKISFGDGLYEGDKKEVTELVGLKSTFPINQIKRVSNEQLVLKTIISNKDVETGYHIKEIGIYGTCDNKEEVLYAYNSAIEADYLPAFNENNLIELEYQNYILIDQAKKVTAVIDASAAYLTKEEAEEVYTPKIILESYLSKKMAEEKYVPQTQTATTEKKGIISENRILELLNFLLPKADTNSIKFENGLMVLFGSGIAGKIGTSKTGDFKVPFVGTPFYTVATHNGYLATNTNIAIVPISGYQYKASTDYPEDIYISFVSYGRWK